MTTVVNIKFDKHDVYIGRGSPFGNPFRIGVHGDRNKCIELYKEYLYKNKKLQSLIKKHCKDKVLGCYCKPLRCHGDVIIEFLLECENENI